MDESRHKFLYSKILKINYEKQDHWDVFKKLFFKKISQFSSMDSFRTNGLSNMLETGLPSQELESALNGNHYSNSYNQIEQKEILKRFEQLLIISDGEIINYPFNSLVGNPRNFKYSYKNKSFYLNFDDLYHVYSAWQIKRIYNLISKKNKPNNILEIGAGYGGLACKLTQIFKNSKYIIIDLPEVLLIQNYYLSKNNPSLKIINLLDFNYQENFDIENIEGDIILVPFTIYKNIQNFKFDLAINTRSFGEMPNKIMVEYIKWIEENISIDGLLYNTNRYVFTKSSDKNKIRDYPYDDFWKPIISQPQWLQTHLHEFLLKRCFKRESIPLSLLLKSFPIQTPPPGPIMQDIQTQQDWFDNQNL